MLLAAGIAIFFPQPASGMSTTFDSRRHDRERRYTAKFWLILEGTQC